MGILMKNILKDSTGLCPVHPKPTPFRFDGICFPLNDGPDDKPQPHLSSVVIYGSGCFAGEGVVGLGGVPLFLFFFFFDLTIL